MNTDSTPVVISVPESAAPDRADKVLTGLLAPRSRAQVQRLFDDGLVFLLPDASRPLTRKHKLNPGDTLRIFLPPPPEILPSPTDIPLEILFEDAHVLAVNKASGTVTHPGAATGADTLVHAALHHTALAPSDDPSRPGIVHRLDKDTSGVILLAKTPEALANLINQFSERKLEKQYLALVHGRPTLLSGSIRVPLGRHPTNRVRMSVREEEGGRPARTDWAVEERFGTCATRLRCWLHTGRTHQIRVHLAHIGHPLLGDATYTLKNIPPNRALPPAARVMLHAERISFFHPITNLPLRILAPIPSDFLDVQEELRSRFGGDRIMPTPT